MRALLQILLVFLVFSSCGKDGKNGTDGAEGKSYLRLTWANLPLALNFPKLPNTVVNGTYYSHSTGTYYATATSWDSSSWNIKYIITSHPGTKGTTGTKGGFLVDGHDGINGSDGADSKFEIAIYGSGAGGPTFYTWAAPVHSSGGEIQNSRWPAPAPTTEPLKTFCITQQSGDASIIVEYYQVK